MTRVGDDLFVRNKREAELAEYADHLAAIIEQTADYYDETGEFPFQHYDLLRDAGYFKLTIPKEFGGEELSLYEMLLVQERLARGDGSTALSVGWHLLTFINLRETKQWPQRIFEKLCRDAVEKGELINVINSEPKTGNMARGARPRTTAKRVRGGYVISGRKAYASLAPVLNQFAVMVYLEDEGVNAEFLVPKNKQVQLLSTWDSLGMRGSGSHDIVLKEVFVPEENLLARLGTDQSNRFTADSRIYSLELPAVYLGIAGAARNYALTFAETTFSKSLEDYVKTAGHVRQKIGEMEILYKSSRSVLYSLAERWEHDPSLRNKLSEEVSMAKYLICNNAIKITELSMRIVGGSSLSRNQKLQRLFRDVQCGLYNPPQDDMVIEQLASTALREVSLHDQNGKEIQIDQYRGFGGKVNIHQKTNP